VSKASRIREYWISRCSGLRRDNARAGRTCRPIRIRSMALPQIRAAGSVQQVLVNCSGTRSIQWSLRMGAARG
jgi:hypothetical protein